MNKIKILYVRCSTLGQNSDRQKNNSNINFDLVIEDKISGTVPFFSRPGGKQVLKLIEQKKQLELYVHDISRLGRDIRDILNTIHFVSEVNKNPIHFITQGLRTIDENGKDNAISNLIISILGTIADMSRKQQREAQLEGIAIAKAQNKYTGRAIGSTEDVHKFLSKPKNKKALEYLKKGYKSSEAAKLAEVHINTMTKIKKLAFANNSQ